MPSNAKLRQKKIEHLQDASLKLIKLIDTELKNEKALPIGLFRVGALTEPQRKAKIAEIEEGKADFTGMSISECAQLLKSSLGALQGHDEPLFSSVQFNTLNEAKNQKDNYLEVIKYILKGKSESNQKIAYCLLTLLNKVSKKKEVTQMGSENLGRMFGPNIFPLIDLNVPKAAIEQAEKQNTICADLIDNVSQLTRPNFNLLSTHYEAQVNNRSENRYHFFEAKGEKLGGIYTQFKGDHLKSRILLNFKKQLEKTTLDNLEQTIEGLTKTKEYEVLATSQGFTTWILGRDTSSVIAFREMVAERKSDLEFEQSLQMK
ncbi:RhoGAP domain-containing protein [Legionella sp. WA2024007413]